MVAVAEAELGSHGGERGKGRLLNYSRDTLSTGGAGQLVRFKAS